jgi:hypothetical protein
MNATLTSEEFSSTITKRSRSRVLRNSAIASEGIPPGFHHRAAHGWTGPRGRRITSDDAELDPCFSAFSGERSDLIGGRIDSHRNRCKRIATIL